MAAQFWTALPLFLLAVAGVDTNGDDIGEAGEGPGETLPLQDEDAEQINLERVVVIRVPRINRAAASASPSLTSPSLTSDVRCLRADSLVGVRVSQIGDIDLLTQNGWYRADMADGCDARQFYSGFYVAKADDGMFCARREELRARSGTMCQVAGFTRWGR